MAGPLDGIRVLELGSLAPAPFGAMLLADLGADVVRVDRPGGPSPLVPVGGPLDRGKTLLEVDLKTPEGLALVTDLARRADVVVEGLRPGTTERLGLGPEHLAEPNPRLVYARVTGWGQTGPLAHTAGHDINYIALSGALGALGPAGAPPTPPANILGDFAGGGMLMALGVVAALLARERTGQGDVVDAAMVDGAALLTTFLHGLGAVGLWGHPRGENLLDGGAPFYATYPCRDGGYLAVGCVEPEFFAVLLEHLDLDPTLLAHQYDRRQWPTLRATLAARFLEKDRDAWADLLEPTDACVTRVLGLGEAPTHDHARARSAFIGPGDVTQPAPAPRFAHHRSGPPAPATRVDGVDALSPGWRPA